MPAQRALVCIRWLGAYARAADFGGMIAFERAPHRHVSAALASADVKVGGATVGLLVDEARTSLVVAFAGDAWTPRNGSLRGGWTHAAECARRSTARTWDRARALMPEIHDYRECLLASPVYSAVVFRRGDERARAYAERVGRAMRLPVMPV